MTEGLLLGDYRDVFADREVDHIITDPPYSARSHDGHNSHRSKPDGSERRKINYTAWAPDDVHEFVEFWRDRNHGWFCCLTDHHLIPHYQEAYRAAGLYSFAPVVCLISGMTVRLSGDGPSSWAVYAMVARPTRLNKWGTLPGGYRGPAERNITRIGGKPMWLMRALVRDYSRVGELVCDPCAGGGTTLRAALENGRRAVGSECDEEAYTAATAQLAKPHALDLLQSGGVAG